MGWGLFFRFLPFWEVVGGVVFFSFSLFGGGPGPGFLCVCFGVGQTQLSIHLLMRSAASYCFGCESFVVFFFYIYGGHWFILDSRSSLLSF